MRRPLPNAFCHEIRSVVTTGRQFFQVADADRLQQARTNERTLIALLARRVPDLSAARSSWLPRPLLVVVSQSTACSTRSIRVHFIPPAGFLFCSLARCAEMAETSVASWKCIKSLGQRVPKFIIDPARTELQNLTRSRQEGGRFCTKQTAK